VIVLTRNGMPLLEQCLAAVRAQETPWAFDVVVVDSESTDGSWELAGALGLERRRVRRAEFNHGATRNAAAVQARGVLVVFLVQDAVPADRGWLRALVAAAERPGAAASYSRQVPHAHANGVVQHYAQAALPQADTTVVQRLAPPQRWEDLSPAQRFALARFHNNSSCIPRALLLERPFRALPYGEDLEWGQRAVRDGLALVYETASTVFHSHDRSGWYELKRAYADHVLVGELFDYRVYPTPRALAASWVHQIVALGRVARREPVGPAARLDLVRRAVTGASARHAGAWLGARAAGRAGRFPWRALDRVLRRGV
jgi:rhamnosyltransferase